MKLPNCASLEHPQWMLHVDPYAHSNMQTGTNIFISEWAMKDFCKDLWRIFFDKKFEVLECQSGSATTGPYQRYTVVAEFQKGRS